MRKFTAFFRLYYNYHKCNMEECDRILQEEQFRVTVTPLVGFVLHVLSALFILSYGYSLAILIWLPIMIGNLVFTHKLSDRFFDEKMRKLDEDLKRMFEQFEQFERARAYEEAKQRQQYHRQQQQQYSSTSRLDIALKFLGLTKSATKDDVKRAYRKLAKKHHPDMGGNKNDFIKLKEHYDYAMSQL
ncbi:DnaJ chaperone protein [Bacillus phage vB_BanS-Thrax3]|nr:DnaJ chaperone protein [Bacillus phage vB_BanS-Thrax3]